MKHQDQTQNGQTPSSTTSRNRASLLDWPSIVNHVVTLLITGLLLGAASLMTWALTTLVTQMQEITALKAQIQASKEVDEGIQEIYSKELFDLRKDIDKFRSESEQETTIRQSDDVIIGPLPPPVVIPLMPDPVLTNIPEPQEPLMQQKLPLRQIEDYEAELRGKVEQIIRSKR